MDGYLNRQALGYIPVLMLIIQRWGSEKRLIFTNEKNMYPYLFILSLYFIIISLFALENNAHCLKCLQLVSTDYFNS